MASVDVGDERSRLWNLVESTIARWRGGEQPDAAGFLARHPEIGARKSLALDLIHEELCLRREAGDTVVASTFISRFPDYRSSIVKMLEVEQYGESNPNFAEALRTRPKSAVRDLPARDVRLVFWTAAAWGAAISVSKDDPALISDQLIVEALLDRALELDEDFDGGAIHGLLIGYEMVRQGAAGDPAARRGNHSASANGPEQG